MKAEIYYKEVVFDVEFDFQPEEPEERYDSNGTGYPGCAESFDNITVFHKGTDFTELLLNDMDVIEELIYEKMRSNLENY